jgi:sporulation protein YlmC with PRC-barrel domain
LRAADLTRRTHGIEAHVGGFRWENAVVKEGSAVRRRDGQTVGHVHQLTFDQHSGRLTRLVVRAGLFWSEERELPTSLIAGVDDGVIYLAVTADELTAHAQ